VIKLSEADWTKVVRLYSSGEVTIAQLAKRFHLTYEGIRYILRQRGVLEPSGQLKRKGHQSVGTAPQRLAL
jgi:hypothetical protein